jgi:hypothetical protein
MSKSKAKGTAFERLIADYLVQYWPYADRAPLTGNKDRGDISGTPGIVWELKNRRALDLAEWVDEAETERTNAGADIGIVVHKRRGRGQPADQYATLRLSTLVHILKEAGY